MFTNHTNGGLLTKAWLRIVAAVMLLMIGLAPIGVPILSDNSWRQTSADTGAAGASQPAAQPFTYRWTDVTSGGASVERSDDGGKSWHGVAAVPEAILDLQAMAGNEQSVVVRTEKNLWISRDGGASWEQAAALPSRPLAMALASGSSNLLLVGTESVGLLRSRDLGATWQPVEEPLFAGGGIAPTALTALAVNGADDNIVYAASAIWLGTSAAHLTPIGTFVSVDGGNTWLELERAPLAAEPVTRLTPVAGQPLTVLAGSADSTHTASLKLTPELLAGLESENAALRASTARALGLLGDPAAAPGLLANVQDADVLAGDNAAEALGRTGNRSVVPALMDLLHSGDVYVRARAAQALGLLKVDAAVPALSTMLNRDDSPARNRAAEALAAIGTPEALQALAGPLADAEMTPARHAAMSGLDAAGAKAAGVLVSALKSGEPSLRANAAEMLGWIRPGSATPGLAEALHDEDATVRGEAAWALGEIAAANGDGATQARAALAQAAQAESDPAALESVKSAQERANRAVTSTRERMTWAEALVAELGRIQTDRWTFLALFIALAAALLWFGPRQAPAASARAAAAPRRVK
jgi:HEAT repeat protein